MLRRPVCRALAAGVAAAAVLSGCGGSGGKAGDGKPGEFIIYSEDAARVDQEQQLLQKEFGDPNHVKVKITAYPVDKFLSQFQNAIRSKAEVDALMLNGQHVGFLQSKGVLAPLDDVVDVNSFEPGAIDPFEIDGKHYAAGIGTLNTSMLAYNADLVKKYGLTVPKTFDDIKADVAKLKGSGVSLLGFGGATVFQWPMWYMEMLQQTTHDKPVETTKATVSGGQPDFTGAPYVEAMRHLKELGASGAFPPGLIGTTSAAAQADFLAGKSAMYWYGSWIINKFVTQAKFPVEIAPFPSFVPGVEPRPTGGVEASVAIFKHVPKSKEELAKKFIQYMTSKDGDVKYMDVTEQAFRLPATKDVTVSAQTPLEKKVITEYVPKTFTFLDWYWPAGVTTAFQQNIQAVVGQHRSPEEAMQAIQQAFEASKANK